MSQKKIYVEFIFYQRLREYYEVNKRTIMSSYNRLTKKFLAYNNKDENPNAFLRKPQFEALEMYVFIKEHMKNADVYTMFDDWRNGKGIFKAKSKDLIEHYKQLNIYDEDTKKVMNELFTQMEQYREDYPNYIYALTMGLGKTILMATCIFYDFLMAYKYPKNNVYFHNAIVFAPDKTVLQSLNEIITFDKTKVIPPEYANLLDINLKYHFLDDNSSFNISDNSKYNIIISNTQKIIVKKRNKESLSVDKLFTDYSILKEIYGDDDIFDSSFQKTNYRFEKLCRLSNLGVFVDEAHHLFGNNLQEQIRNNEKTSLRNTINMLHQKNKIIACYNYTGTPYINKQILPEVVYCYSLQDAILNGYLKNVEPVAYDKVKEVDFLNHTVETFLKKYGNKKYDGLRPKLAIYASTVNEAVKTVRPALEKILAKHKISNNTILLNVGNPKYTKDEDIRDFNDLDIVDSQGNKKQFIILVAKGKEGWNCKSLFGVAMFRQPSSTVFVLQATMRCMRQITNVQHTATVFLSTQNWQILNEELEKNFNISINDVSRKNTVSKKIYKITVVPPERSITVKRITYKYSVDYKEYNSHINFNLKQIDLDYYKTLISTKSNIIDDSKMKEILVDITSSNNIYSLYSLAGEIARYMNLSPILIYQILEESIDGSEYILDIVNKYNDIIYEYIIPKIFSTLYNINITKETKDETIILLKKPEDKEYYEVSSIEDLVISNKTEQYPEEIKEKSFHADTYCFDSYPEKVCFDKYIKSSKVKEIYFTGMFTAKQGDLYIQYYDPETSRIRSYYPDFLAKMEDDTYQLIEVKGDNMIDDITVKAKADAANELAVASGFKYIIYKGSDVLKGNLLE